MTGPALGGAVRLPTAAQMAALDRRAADTFGIPTLLMMEHAGSRVARVAASVLEEVGGGAVVVLAGKGSNGGDGFVAARHLANAGVHVEVLLLADADEVRGDAAAMLRPLEAMGVPVTPVASPDAFEALGLARVIVDAIVGTGFAGPARGIVAEAIEAANRSAAPIVAVDIPSGVHADTGAVVGPCIRAAATVTMGLPKPGLLLYPGAGHAGRIFAADLGVPRAAYDDPEIRTWLVTAPSVASVLPVRPGDAHKGDAGRVLVIAGSEGFTGAPELACLGALRTGAGLVTLGTPRGIYPIVAAKLTEAMPHPLPGDTAVSAEAVPVVAALVETADAVVAGPGLGTGAGAAAVVDVLVRSGRPLVLDADALTLHQGRAGDLRRSAGPLVITPHPGEMARLLDSSVAEVQADRLSTARSAAERTAAVVVLKGARTVVASPDGRAWVVPTGNPAMAGGGVGDVLCGVIGALLAQRLDPADAAWAGAYLHGLAGDLAAVTDRGMLASDLAARLPDAVAAVRARTAPDPVIAAE